MKRKVPNQILRRVQNNTKLSLEVTTPFKIGPTTISTVFIGVSF
jgi:hypothetical protein